MVSRCFSLWRPAGTRLPEVSLWKNNCLLYTYFCGICQDYVLYFLYKGHSINKLQNGVILSNVKIWKIQNTLWETISSNYNCRMYIHQSVFSHFLSAIHSLVLVLVGGGLRSRSFNCPFYCICRVGSWTWWQYQLQWCVQADCSIL